MSRFLTKVSVAIRILQRDRDVSARASHLAKRVISLQAEMGKFLISTVLERNIMSTKTTFKRVALVVAAAVSFGGVSAVSSHAVDNNVLIAFSSGDGAGVAPYNTGAGVAGVANSVTVNVGALAAGRIYVTVSGAGATLASHDGNALTTGATSFYKAGGSLVEATNAVGTALVINTPTVGTITVSAYSETGAGTGIFSSSADETVAITVGSAAVNNKYSAAKSTVLAVAGSDTTTATTTTDAAYAVSADSAASGTLATYVVTQKDANGTNLSSGYKAVTAYTSGGKLTGTTGTWTGDGSSYISTTGAAVSAFKLESNGVVGSATITISINGVVAKSYSATFTSSVAKTLALTAGNTNIATSATASLVGTPLGTTAAKPAYVLVAKDVNGNQIKTASISGVTPKSSDTTVAATPTIGSYSSTLGGYPVYTTGAAAGSATLSVTSSADATITASGAVNVVDAKIASLALSLDNTSYAPGDLVTASLTAANAAGKVVADGTYVGVLSGALSSNQSLPNGASAFAADVKFVNGVGTATFYAPGSSFTVKATLGTASSLATAIQETSSSASATVVNAAVDAANAAADAAAEATDAANAATDAATNAMDSADAAQQAAMDAGDKADAALAAITDLASKVQSFITSISAQISALAAAVAKIKAKVKA